MRVITNLGLNNENPYLIYFSVSVAAVLLVYIVNIGYKKTNSLLFSRYIEVCPEKDSTKSSDSKKNCQI